MSGPADSDDRFRMAEAGVDAPSMANLPGGNC